MAAPGRVKLGLIASIALVALAATPSAQARGTFGDLQLTYIKNTELDRTGPQQWGPVIADCNDFDAGFPLSGGNVASGPVGEIYLNTAYPQPDLGASDPNGLPDGWRVFDDIVGSGNQYDVGAALICSGVGAPAYPDSSTTPNAIGDRNSAAVLCPGGTHVTGGGNLASGFLNEQRTAISAPIDSQDANRTPDDGWRVDMDNIGPDLETVTAYAICHPDDGFSYTSARFEARRNDRANGKALCPQGSLNVGGGVKGTGPFNSTWIVDHYTSTRFSGQDTVNEGWRARMEVNAGPPRSFKVFAICHD